VSGEHDPHEHDPTEGTARLETFSDGVMAIVITLLVFTIEIPSGEEDLGRFLRSQWPSYVAFVTAFLMLGVWWVNHHELFRLIRRTTHGFLLVNVVFLMSVALLPLPAQMIARYWGTDGETVALVVMGGVATFAALMWNAIWFFALKHGLLYEDLGPQRIRAYTRRTLMGAPTFLVGMILAVVSPPASLAFYLIVVLFYMLPSRRPRAVTREPAA
jgi:uncharacterized membrane protein